jgi:hypothetical protein
MKYYAQYSYLCDTKYNSETNRFEKCLPFLVEHIGSGSYGIFDGRKSVYNIQEDIQKHINQIKSFNRIDNVKIYKSNDFRAFLDKKGFVTSFNMKNY